MASSPTSEVPGGGTPAAVTCNVCRAARYPQLQAAKKGHVQCLMSSLERAGLVDKKGRFEALDVDEFGATAMHHCCRHDQVQCLSVLVKLAHVKECVRAKNGATALHDAAATGSVRCLNYLLTNTQHSITACDKTGNTPLHWAVQAKQEDAVIALLQAKGSTCTSATKLGVTPLHVASAKNCVPVLKHLVNFCLSHDEEGVIDFQAKSGATAAYFAAQEGNTECVKYLAEVGKADLTLRAKDNMMCLHATAQHGHLECLQWIIQHCGPQHVKDRGPDNASIAHFAASQGNIECLEWILTETQLSGKERDAFGATPLHDAADNNQLECVKRLLDHEVLAVAVDNDDHTPGDLATAAGYTEIAAYIKTYLDEVKEREKQRRLAAAKMKQQEEQEKKAKAKLEKQQKKEQKALLKMQQEEEKQRQKELKRQESKLAAEAKQAEAMKSSKLVPPEASEATLAEDSVTEELTLPEKHEDWSKLEDEAHALALKEGIEQSRASVSSDMLGDKLATSGPVSFQLSDDTSARGSTRKKDKKEKAKGRRGFGRWIKRSSSDKKEAVTPEKKGLSRRSSHSSTGTEQRPSSPGSQTSLTTPHGSHPDMSVDGEDENYMDTSLEYQGYVKKQKKHFDTQIQKRQSHFGRFWQGKDSKQTTGDRPRSGKKDRPSSAGKVSTASTKGLDASIDLTDARDEVDRTAEQGEAVTTAQRRSRFTTGLSNIAISMQSLLSRGNRQASSFSDPAYNSDLPSPDSVLNEAALEEVGAALENHSQEETSEDAERLRVVAEAVMVVGDDDSDDTPETRKRKLTMTSGIMSSVSTGMGLDSHRTWTPGKTPEHEEGEDVEDSQANTATREFNRLDTDESNMSPPEDPPSATTMLRHALEKRQASLATNILLGSPTSDDNIAPEIPFMQIGGVAVSAQADSKHPDNAEMHQEHGSPESALLGGSVTGSRELQWDNAEPAALSCRAKSLEQLSTTRGPGTGSDQLFDKLKTRLFADSEPSDVTTSSGGLEAALRGASSMEYIASQRETCESSSTHLVTASKSEQGLAAALFNANSMEHLASQHESQDRAPSSADAQGTKIYDGKNASTSLDQIAHAVESDVVAGSHREGSGNNDESTAPSRDGTANEAMDDATRSEIDRLLAIRPAATTVYVGDDMLPQSRTSTSLTLSTGTLDTIDEGENEPDEKEQSPEDKYRYQLATLQQRASQGGGDDTGESSRRLSQSSSLPALVESDVGEDD